MPILKTVLIFVLAGLCEIGGGYLVWLVVKEGKSIWYAIVGSLILILYGFVATLQPANFAKVYATYGGYSLCSPCFGHISLMAICLIDMKFWGQLLR